jgi:hypothetical protein
MGRAWRIKYEGALYLILSRGNEQGDAFYDNTDRGRFLDIIGELKKLSRVSGAQKEKRDIILYLIWQTGLLTNEKIAAIFDLTYSSVSHSVKAVKSKMAKEHKFRDYIENLYSQFTV